MKKILFTLLMSGICIVAGAQVTDNESKLRDKKSTVDTTQGWKFGGMTDIKFSNTKLYNWAAGGDNTIALNGVANLHANYAKGKNAWDNSLDLGYGIMRQGSKELENGQNFSIVELNGSGSEPTHIYDPKHSIFFAWKELARHISYMYKISVENHKRGFPYLTHKEGMKQYRLHLEQSKKIVDF